VLQNSEGKGREDKTKEVHSGRAGRRSEATASSGEGVVGGDNEVVERRLHGKSSIF
jgi:hypothetical protein